MQSQEKVGVCNVGDFLVDGLHVPHVAIERPSDLGKVLHHLADLAPRVTRVVTGDIAEEKYARALQLRDGAQEAPWRSEISIRHFEI